MMSWVVEVGVDNNDKIKRFLKVLEEEAYQIEQYENMFINSSLQYNLIKQVYQTTMLTEFHELNDIRKIGNDHIFGLKKSTKAGYFQLRNIYVYPLLIGDFKKNLWFFVCLFKPKSSSNISTTVKKINKFW